MGCAECCNEFVQECFGELLSPERHHVMTAYFTIYNGDTDFVLWKYLVLSSSSSVEL